MKPASRPPVRTALVYVATCTIVALLALTGCGKSKTTQPKPTGSTTYTGAVTGRTTSGTLTITIATSNPAQQQETYRAQSVVTASGTFTPSGGAGISLSGTYDDQGNAVIVSGSGWTFTADNVTAADMKGLFTGPTPSPNTEIGDFNLQSGTSDVTVFIGTFTSTNGHDNGRFNFSIKGGTVHGSAWEATGTSAIPLDGTYDANRTPDQILIVNPADPQGAPAAKGNYDTGTGVASGTYTAGTNSGNWTGNKQN